MKDVVIIGAGLAGLRCANILQQAGLDVALLEAADAPGGRVRTDAVDGFLLDRGFQVLLTEYPEAKSALDYPALQLRSLKPGALVWHGGRFHRFADPFRDPIAAVALALDPIVTLTDKLGVARLRARVMKGAIPEIFGREETTTRAYLLRFGFSSKILNRFFAPFFGGVFLETELATSSRYFEFLFRMFSSGAVAVPAAGMGAIPRQLASRLKSGTLQLKSVVSQIVRNESGFVVRLEGAQLHIEARAVVVATDEPAARQLLQPLYPMGAESAPRRWNSTTAFYFAADRAPVESPVLLLNGEGSSAGPVNNAVVMSEVSDSYAPAGASLISASAVGRAPTHPAELNALEAEVREHLSRWLGKQVAGWRSLGAYPIPRALPFQATAAWEESIAAAAMPGIFLCGDHSATASIQGALSSGRRAAEALLAALAK
jgi:phytoene dehydrogenase-like protein